MKTIITTIIILCRLNLMTGFAQDDCIGLPYKVAGSAEEIQSIINSARQASANAGNIDGQFEAGVGKPGKPNCTIKKVALDNNLLIPITPVMELSRGENINNLIDVQVFENNNTVEAITMAVNGSGTFIIDKIFYDILLKPEYYCYGIPCANTVIFTCYFCRMKYKSQKFVYQGFNNGTSYMPPSHTEIMVGAKGCPSHLSRTGNHDGLVLYKANPCGDPIPCGNHYNINR